MLPFEIWKDISLLLPYNHLAVSKDSSKIYDEDWFENKLKLRYPDLETEDYQLAYKRSLQSGRILFYGKMIHDTKLEGINICSDIPKYLVLTFDGKFSSHTARDSKLIDNNVVAIDGNNYIKKHEWYTNSSYLILKSEEQFLSCSSIDRHYFAATSNHVYRYNSITDMLIMIDLPDIIKIVNIDDCMVIQNRDGLYAFISRRNEYRIEKIDIAPVDKLYPGCAKLKDGSIVTIRINCETKYFAIEKLSTPNNNLFGACFPRYYFDTSSLLLLLGDHVYMFQTGRDLTLIRNDVKRIENGFFII